MTKWKMLRSWSVLRKREIKVTYDIETVKITGIFSDLKVNRVRLPNKALIKGEWI